VHEFKQFDYRDKKDGVLYGCYGYYNEDWKKIIATYYVADRKGTRTCKPYNLMKVYPNDGLVHTHYNKTQ
jgi:hypothetical protein